MQRLTLLLMSCVLFLACTSVDGAGPSLKAGGEDAPAADARKNSDVIPLKQVLDAPAGFDGKEVSVQGVFRGWKGTCPSSAMLTRSDWLLEDETGCIYITGRMPDDVSPANPRGERILVKGRILLGTMGKPILKADQLNQMLKK